jgi:hypothetical protein
MAERRPQNQDRRKPMQIPREALWVLAVLGGLVLVLFALVVGPWWFTRHPHHGLTAEQELKAKNDVRTTLVQALGGLAVAGGLAVTYRTYRQNRTEQDRTYELRQAEQANERYTKAVEQLGHEKAPVRLGALHSLARLAQDNLELRPLVVDVLCAYLRMPYNPPMPDEPTEPVAAAVEATSRNSDREKRERDAAREELQVRKTAQRLLADHLRPAGRDARRIKASREELFWPNTSLDLTGAALVDFDFKSVSVVQARFAGATFQGTAAFTGATFQGDAAFSGAQFSAVTSFDGAQFSGNAWFGEAAFQSNALFAGATFQGTAAFTVATFQGDAWFDRVTFQGTAAFERAAFQGNAAFGEGTFQGNTVFDMATFQGNTWFPGATFQSNTEFGGAQFSEFTRFDGAQFSGNAWFGRAAFPGNADFGGAAFQGDAWFGGATFQGTASFEGATFEGPATFAGATFESGNGGMGVAGATVLHLDDPDLNGSDHRVWPDGYTVRPDPADPTRGTLVHGGQAEEPEPPVSPPDRPADHGLGTG